MDPTIIFTGELERNTVLTGVVPVRVDVVVKTDSEVEDMVLVMPEDVDVFLRLTLLVRVVDAVLTLVDAALILPCNVLAAIVVIGFVAVLGALVGLALA